MNFSFNSFTAFVAKPLQLIDDPEFDDDYYAWSDDLTTCCYKADLCWHMISTQISYNLSEMIEKLLDPGMLRQMFGELWHKFITCSHRTTLTALSHRILWGH